MRRLSLGLVVLAACSASREQTAASEAAATASTELTPPVGTLIASGPSAHTQEEPAIAKANGQYLAAWIEDQAVHAMRLDAHGKPIDDRSLALADKTGWDGEPAIASDGDGYLVVWTHAEPSGRSIRAARIQRDGYATPATTLASDAVEPSVAWNGREYLVAWTAAKAPPSIRAARVSKAGVASADFDVSAPSYCGHSAISAAKDTFLVAWQEPAGVRAKRIDIDAAPFTVINHGAAPAVASDGTTFWVATHPTTGIDLTPVRDGAAGETLSIDRDTIGVPAVAWDRDSLIVAWEDSARRVKGETITTLPSAPILDHSRPAVADAAMILRAAQSHVTTPDQRPIARGDATQRAPVAAYDGRRYLVVWEEIRTDWQHPEIWAAFVKDAVPNPPFQLGEGTKPSIVWDGMKYVVAWEIDSAHMATTAIDYEGAFPAATTFSATDAHLVTGGGNSFVVTSNLILSASDPTRAVYTSADPIEVAWDGASFVGAWMHDTTVVAAHFDSEWTRVEAAPLEIATIENRTALHLAGDDHGTALIAWDTGHGIVGKRVGTSVLDANALRLDGTLDTKSCDTPMLAFDGKAWLTAYRTQGEVELTRLASDGRRSAALTLGTGSVTMTSGPEHETLFALESDSRLALRVLRDVRSPTPDPPPPPPSSDDDDDTTAVEHGAPAFKEPAARPGKAASPTPTATASDGCAMGQRSSTGNAWLVVLALLVRRRFARRTRVPHTRR